MANLDFISGPLSDSDRWCVVRLARLLGRDRKRGGEAILWRDQ